MISKEKILERLEAILRELEERTDIEESLYWFLVGKLKAYDLILAEDVPPRLWERIDKYIEF